MQGQNPFQRFNWKEVYWQHRRWQFTSVMLFDPSAHPGEAGLSSLCRRACWAPGWWAWARAQSCPAPRLRAKRQPCCFAISVSLCVSNSSLLFCFALLCFRLNAVYLWSCWNTSPRQPMKNWKLLRIISQLSYRSAAQLLTKRPAFLRRCWRRFYFNIYSVKAKAQGSVYLKDTQYMWDRNLILHTVVWKNDFN